MDLTIVGQKGNEQDLDIFSKRGAIMQHLEDKIKDVVNQLCQVIWVKNQGPIADLCAGYKVVLVEDLPRGLKAYQVKSKKNVGSYKRRSRYGLMILKIDEDILKNTRKKMEIFVKMGEKIGV